MVYAWGQPLNYTPRWREEMKGKSKNRRSKSIRSNVNDNETSTLGIYTSACEGDKDLLNL